MDCVSFLTIYPQHWLQPPVLCVCFSVYSIIQKVTDVASRFSSLNLPAIAVFISQVLTSKDEQH